MKYITLLYLEVDEIKKIDKKEITPECTNKFDIKEHDNLRDAIKYLIKHGANYDQQKVVTEIDWMPNKDEKGNIPPLQPVGDQKSMPENLAPLINTDNTLAEQPQVIDLTNTADTGRPLSVSERLLGTAKKKSILSSFLPPFIVKQIQEED